MFDYETLINQLKDLKEESYAEFSSKLLPNTTSIWGIRLPYLRKIAKQISKKEIHDYFLQVKHEFFEETLLMGFVIGTMEPSRYSLEEIFSRIEAYLPHIHNWSVCDSFCSSLKIAKAEPGRMFDFLENLWNQTMERKLIASNQEELKNICEETEFIQRFVIVMWLNYFIKDDYVARVFHYLSLCKSEQYYVNMAIAWCFSMIYIQYPKMIEDYLHGNWRNQSSLDSSDLFVHNKTIRKICESYQVEEERKNKIRSFRITLKS